MPRAWLLLATRMVDAIAPQALPLAIRMGQVCEDQGDRMRRAPPTLSPRTPEPIDPQEFPNEIEAHEKKDQKSTCLRVSFCRQRELGVVRRMVRFTNKPFGGFMKSEKQKLELDIESMKQLANKLNEVLSEDIVPLSDEERGRLGGVRLGFERYAAMIAEVARENGIEVKGRDIETLQKSIALSAALEVLYAKIALAFEQVGDTMLRERAAAFKTFLAYYRRLEAIACEVPEVAKVLEPVVEFLTTQKRTTKSANADVEETTPQPVETPTVPLGNVTPLKVTA